MVSLSGARRIAEKGRFLWMSWASDCCFRAAVAAAVSWGPVRGCRALVILAILVG